MATPPVFNFSDNSVASAYDNVLVPLVFDPWARRLIEEHAEWEGRRVLDLATGTGVVARLLAEKVGAAGEVIGTDINKEMLAIARQRCAEAEATVRFVESPAHPLQVEDESVDVVVCQQGFQFFPDRAAAASEMHRVLVGTGRVMASTWRPVTECELFGVICEALCAVDAPDIADMMRVPFDFMPETELAAHFESAGFRNVAVRRLEQELVLDGGVPHALETAYATPIAPQLRALPEEKQDAFRRTMSERLDEMCDDGVTMGRMVSNVLIAEKRT